MTERTLGLCIAIGALALMLSGMVRSADSSRATDEVAESTRLFRQGNHAQALDRINAFLNANPKDAKARFLKGIILTEQGKSADAIKMFTALTEDFPELPEPYNNLAVLHAQAGQFDKARTALEMAIRTHPSYATAHENLGDIYAKMASQAYDKALQLDKGNTAAQTKLELIRDLFSNSPRSAKPAPKADASRAPEPTKAAVATPAKPVPAAPTIVATAPASPPTKAAVPEAPKAASVQVEVVKPVPPKAAVAPTETAKPPLQDDSSAEAIRAVQAWAGAWASNDVSAYLGHYAPDFKTPNGESRTAWAETRKARIAKPRKIEVSVDSPSVRTVEGGRLAVSFRQHYKSGALNTSSNKTLLMAKVEGKWLIQQEQVGK